MPPPLEKDMLQLLNDTDLDLISGGDGHPPHPPHPTPHPMTPAPTTTATATNTGDINNLQNTGAIALAPGSRLIVG
jgi:hypothetical protein